MVFMLKDDILGSPQVGILQLPKTFTLFIHEVCYRAQKFVFLHADEIAEAMELNVILRK